HLTELGRLVHLASSQDLGAGLEHAHQLGRGVGDALEDTQLGLGDDTTPELDRPLHPVHASSRASGQALPSPPRALYGLLCLPEHAPRCGEKSLVRPAQCGSFRVAADGSPGDLGDLALTSSDASSHVAKATRRSHPLGPHTLDLTTEHLGDVLTKTRVARI